MRAYEISLGLVGWDLFIRDRVEQQRLKQLHLDKNLQLDKKRRLEDQELETLRLEKKLRLEQLVK
jgi:hypothetical protein